MKINNIVLGFVALFVGTLLSAGTAWALPGFFAQGGNSFAETATLGTTDNFDLRVITNNTEKARITSAGAATFGGSLGVTGATTLSGGATIACTGCITNANLAGALTGKTYNGLIVSNTTGTLTLANGSTLATSGANSITLTSTGATNVTLPTSGTLVDSGVATLSSLASIGTITTGTWNGTTIAVANGGTGATTFTTNGVLYGNGTGAIQATPAGTAGQVLTSNGVGFSPTWQTASMPTQLEYFEIQPFSSSNLNQTNVWEDWDLSSVIPSGAKYVEIMMAPQNTASEQWIEGGVRANGSSVNRSVGLYSSANNTLWSPTTTVILDGGRIVDRFSHPSSGQNFRVLFTAFGYWK